MYKLLKIVMLPTLNEVGYSIKKAFKNGHTYMQWDNLGECPHGFYKPHHLYFLSDEELKDGDLTICLGELDTSVMNWKLNQAIGNWNKENTCTSCRKIVATTDTNLSTECSMCASEEITRAYTCKCVSSPIIPQAFLNGYCRRGGIDEVMVEYEVTNRCCGRCDGVHDFCFADIICTEHKDLGCPECYGPRGDVIKLKVNSNNEIIIEPVRDSWNRKEIVDMFHDFALYKTSMDIDETNEWINENLK